MCDAEILYDDTFTKLPEHLLDHTYSCFCKTSSILNSSNGNIHFKVIAAAAAKLKKETKAEHSQSTTSKPDMDAKKKHLDEMQQTMLNIATAKNESAVPTATPVAKGSRKLKLPVMTPPEDAKKAEQNAMKEILKTEAPGEDISSDPKSAKKSCKAVNSLAQVKQSGWNKLLKANSLSIATGRSKEAKAEHTPTHMTTVGDDE